MRQLAHREYISIEVIKYPFAISCEGKNYKRSGSTLHELNGFELQNFLLERAGKTWDAVPPPGISVDDLSKTAIEAFRKKAVKSGRMSEAEVDIDDETLLRNLKLFDGQYLTRATVLLFHPEPELYATGAYIKIGYFAKVGAFGKDSEIIEDLQYQDVIEGPLILQVDKANDLIFSKYFKGLVDYDGVQRTETKMLKEYGIIFAFAALGTTPVVKLMAEKLYSEMRSNVARVTIRTALFMGLLFFPVMRIVVSSYNPFIYFRF